MTPELPLVLRLAVAVAAVLVLPGSAALTLAGHRGRGLGRLALAVGLSVAVVPLAALWWSALGGRWTRPGLATALGGCALVTAAYGRQLWQRRRAGGGGERVLAAVAVVLVVATAVAVRAGQAVDLAALPWVDGLHHTMIVQLFIDHGAVPADYRPYLDGGIFYYHFGFHAAAAVVAVVADAPARLAALWLGQALNASAGLVLWRLARRLGVPAPASVWAAAVPTGLFFFPAYFLSWGRETQLAGLVVAPVAIALLLDVVQPEVVAPAGRQDPAAGAVRGWRAVGGSIVLAAAAAAGLVLVHYRVTVFFVLAGLVVAGGLVVSAVDAVRRRPARDAAARLAVAAAVALILVLPWLVRHFGPGVAQLQRASRSWIVGPAGVERIEPWMLTIHLNAVWLAVAAGGLGVALARRSAAAVGVAAWLALAVAVVAAPWLGLPRSWMLPPSSLVISAFAPVALGTAMAAAEASRRARRRFGRRAVTAVVALGAVAAGWLGARGQRDVVNPDTILLTSPDLTAAAWVADHTPPAARFLIGTVHWQFDTYRGVDGGYWLPLTAGRATSLPPALYVYGAPDDVRRIGALAAVAARGDALSVGDLSRLMDQAAATHVYAGAPAAPGRGFTAARLRRQPDLRQVYARDGVAIFERVRGASARSGQPAPSLDETARMAAPRRHRACSRSDHARAAGRAVRRHGRWRRRWAH